MRNTFLFPVEMFAHHEDDLMAVESYQMLPGGPTIQVECPIVGQLYKVINQETSELIASVIGATEDQDLIIGP